MSTEVAQILRRAEAIAREGGRAALCVIVRASGSTPQSAGSLMLVDADASLRGTVGGGCVEAEVRRLAHGLLHEGRSDMLRFRLDSDYGWDDGLICGGTVEIAVTPLPDAVLLGAVADSIERGEPATLPILVQTADGPIEFRLQMPSRERLLIAGAGHIGQALARHGIALGFAVTLVDDRLDLLRSAESPGLTCVGGDIAAALRELPIDNRTYAVIVTRGHRHDEEALAAVLGRGAPYVGMIGSRRKVKLITDDLAARGADREALARVHAPIGLPIGAVTVEEIAVSIAAQLVQVRRTAEAAPLCVTRMASAGELSAPPSSPDRRNRSDRCDRGTHRRDTDAA